MNAPRHSLIKSYYYYYVYKFSCSFIIFWRVEFLRIMVCLTPQMHYQINHRSLKILLFLYPPKKQGIERIDALKLIE